MRRAQPASVASGRHPRPVPRGVGTCSSESFAGGRYRRAQAPDDAAAAAGLRLTASEIASIWASCHPKMMPESGCRGHYPYVTNK